MHFKEESKSLRKKKEKDTDQNGSLKVSNPKPVVVVEEEVKI